MRLLLAGAILGSLLPSALAFPSASAQRKHVIHEKRDTIRSRLIQSGELDPDHIVPARIGLKQSNIDLGAKHLQEISDPNSPRYGNHYTIAEVTNLFAPSAETVEIIKNWMVDSGLPEDRISQSTNKAWLQFDASIVELEQLFQTKFYYYEDVNGGPKHIGCEEYKVPAVLSEHIDYVTPGVKTLTTRAMGDIMKRNLAYKRSLRPVRKAFPDHSLAVRQSAANLSECASSRTSLTPECVRTLYNIPLGTLSNPTNSLGIFSQISTYSQEDLDLFYATYAPFIPKGTQPKPAFIDGATAPAGPNDSGLEAMIDFEMAYPIVYPQTTTDYQTDGTQFSISRPGIFNNFLDAIDGSYCTYTYGNETGDDPNIDPVYPAGKHDCGTLSPTNVISLSYGLAESHYSMNYQIRQCNEFMKLALQGVTVVAASGDSGVTDQGSCLSAGGTNNIFSPTFPSCPYITLVGATELSPDGLPERAVSNFASGGGFSNTFAQPDYQATAVNSFFANRNPTFPSYSSLNGTIGENGGVYNRIGRAYPDIAAVGNNGAMIYRQDTETPATGTSMSTPIVAAIFTRINDERLAVGKKPIGFVNPTLYANPQMFNDITVGDGSWVPCGGNFFSCVQGWDPVTGLGTPKYDEWLSVFMALP